MDTIETLKQELKDLLYEAAMTNNILFTGHPSADRAFFDNNSILGIGCFGLDNMKRLKKLCWIISEHEKTGEDPVMLALRYQSK